MKQIIITCCLVMAATTTAWGQQKGKQKLSQDEFRAKQMEFITREAELTPEEAARFFALYFELQEKKQVLGKKALKAIRKENDSNLREADYERLMDEAYEARIQTAQLEKEYYLRYKQVIPIRKLFHVHKAEMKFKRHLLKGGNTPRQQ